MPSLRPSGDITSLVESRKPRFTCSGTPLQRCIYRRGGRAEKLQKILGHKTADMTQRYAHYVTDDLVEDIDDFTF